MLRTYLSGLFYSMLFVFIFSIASVKAEGPSFDCSAVEDGSIEQMVCKDQQLSSLDNKLSQVYKQAKAIDDKAVGGYIAAEQRGWIKGRNDCWKSSDIPNCVKTEYQRRIAELQAKYRIITPNPTKFYACDGNPANEVVVNYFDTQPKSIIAERGDKSFMMFQSDVTDMIKYDGGDQTLILEGDDIQVSFEFQGPLLNCKNLSPKKPTGMHPSWDTDQNGVNDCENDGSCDHTVDYSLPRAAS